METYRAATYVTAQYGTKQVSRSASTGIYFLICPGNVSRLHRIQSDEMWHFYLGGPMTVVELDNSHPDGYKATVIGQDITKGQVVQYVVKAGVWFGSYPNEGTLFSFVGCSVAPGFDFSDFELADRAELLTDFPKAATIIEKLT